MTVRCWPRLAPLRAKRLPTKSFRKAGCLSRAIGKFEGRSTLKTWLVRIASNGAKTRLRKERRTT
ncbi:MAG: hypothetical protein CMQ05_12390 [Gammaproteobacteria bacterium]|nr:hypothetical protein [Gammaproteobacteria bacterium]RPG25335.1 MAG: hypothetical protein CBC10_008635 [Gammaproteobacteria bacterium TMED50]